MSELSPWLEIKIGHKVGDDDLDDDDDDDRTWGRWGGSSTSGEPSPAASPASAGDFRDWGRWWWLVISIIDVFLSTVTVVIICQMRWRYLDKFFSRVPGWGCWSRCESIHCEQTGMWEISKSPFSLLDWRSAVPTKRKLSDLRRCEKKEIRFL